MKITIISQSIDATATDGWSGVCDVKCTPETMLATALDHLRAAVIATPCAKHFVTDGGPLGRVFMCYTPIKAAP